MIILKKWSAIFLFATTIAAIAVMWQPAFWASALPQVAIFTLAAVWMISVLIRPRDVRCEFVLVPLTTAALWPWAQIAINASIYRWMTSLSALYWAAAAAVVFVGLQVFSDASIRKSYLRALVVAGFAMAIVAPLQRFTSDGKIFWLFEVPFSNIAMGPFIYPTQYAAFIELVLPIALYGVFSERGNWRTFYGLAAAVMYASVFASASRTGFALTTAEILLVPLLAAKRNGVSRQQLFLPAMVFLAMIVVLGLAVGPEALIGKLRQEDPYRGRREFVDASLRMVRDKPLFGVGMGNWSTAYPAYETDDSGLFVNEAHNDWVQWAVEGGVPFALMMFSVFLWSVPRAFRSGWGFGICVVFLHCYVDYPIQRMGVAIVFFGLLAAIAYPEDSRESN